MRNGRIVLVGGGGHASDVLGALEAIFDLLPGRISDFVAGIVADDEIDMARFRGRGVEQIGSIDDLARLDVGQFIAAVGYPSGRKAVADRALAAGLEPYTVIHPQAMTPKKFTVGPGTVILAGTCISPLVSFGAHAYVSHGALVGHDCEVGDFTSIMPGASISGDTRLGDGVMIGANATVLEKRTIGAGAIIGAGAVVTKNVPAGETWIGSPARPLR